MLFLVGKEIGADGDNLPEGKTPFLGIGIFLQSLPE
jgi:hypothetical protein